jgi:hypothetical protein
VLGAGFVAIDRTKHEHSAVVKEKSHGMIGGAGPGRRAAARPDKVGRGVRQADWFGDRGAGVLGGGEGEHRAL